MRQIHWRMSFTALNKTLYTVDIYHEGYSGEIVSITGAAQPIITEEKNSFDIMDPLRTSTGTISILCYEDMREIFPEDTLERYVTLKKGDKLIWQGYIQCGSMNQAWDSYPIELSFNITSCLGVLDSIEASATNLNLRTIGSMLKEMFDASGGEFENLYYPCEWLQSSYLDILNIKMHKGCFFSRSDVASDSPLYSPLMGKTYSEILASILTLFGWVAYERGKDLYFVVPGVSTSFAKVPVSSLDNPSSFEEINIEVQDMTSVAGDDNTISSIPPYRCIDVIAKANTFDTEQFSISTDGDGIRYLNRDFQVLISSNYWYRGYEYEPLADITGLTINTYELNYSVPEVLDEIVVGSTKTVAELLDAKNYKMGAALVKAEYYAINDKDRKNHDYANELFIGCDYMYLPSEEKYNAPTLEQMKECPIISFKSRNPLSLVAGCINIDSAGGSKWKGTPNQLLMRCKIGDKYWDGRTWTTEEAWFDFKIGYDQKTINIPYEGAHGTFLTVDSVLAGYLEIDLVFPQQSPHHDSIGKFDIKILMPDNYVQSLSDTKHYYNTCAKTGDKKELSLDIITDNNHVACNNALIWENALLKDQFLYNNRNTRPETALASKLASIFNRRHDVTSITVDDALIAPYFVKQGQTYFPLFVSRNYADSEMTINLLS